MPPENYSEEKYKRELENRVAFFKAILLEADKLKDQIFKWESDRLIKELAYGAMEYSKEFPN